MVAPSQLTLVALKPQGFPPYPLCCNHVAVLLSCYHFISALFDHMRRIPSKSVFSQSCNECLDIYTHKAKLQNAMSEMMAHRAEKHGDDNSLAHFSCDVRWTAHRWHCHKIPENKNFQDWSWSQHVRSTIKKFSANLICAV